MLFEKDIDSNISTLEEALSDCGDIVKRKFPIGSVPRVWGYVIYIDGLVLRDVVESSILENLLVQIRSPPPSSSEVLGSFYEAVRDGGFASADFKEVEDIDETILAILCGDTVFLIDGTAKAIVLSTKGWPNRGIGKPETEMLVQGPKEAFTETIRFNTALIRRRIRDRQLKIEQIKLGERSQTDLAIVYLKDVVRPQVLNDVKEMLNGIHYDAVLDSGYIQQFMEKGNRTVFPLVQDTERPDKAAAAILEGRVVIIVDNSPFVILAPATLNCFFQAADDYYQRPAIMSFTRVLRYIAAMLAVCLPGLFLAITVYHPDLVPTALALKFAAARANVPFPGVVEILIMELAFELLREAGIRLPTNIGSAMGIVGGLIVGQAAVEAGIVSPIVVIIVAVTAISSFSVPHVSLVTAFRIMKFLVIILASVFGFFGFWLAVLLILTHMVSLNSLNFPYMFPFVSGEVNGYSDLKDGIIRAPFNLLKKRPLFANPKQIKRG